MSDVALREDREGVVCVTWNRPEKLNAVNREMLGVLRQAIDDLRERDDLRVLLIRGKGRFFTAGIDLMDGPMDRKPNASMTSVRRDYRIPLHVLFDELE